MFRYMFVLAICAQIWQSVVAQTATPPAASESSPSFSNGTSTISASPTWTSANFPTFPPEFSDIPADTLSCWKSWANYKIRLTAPNPGVITSSRVTTFISTYPTPITSTFLSTETDLVTGIAHLVGLTTLCDGYPRASSASYELIFTTYLVKYTYATDTTYIESTIPGVTKSGYEVIEPTCTVAPNDSPLCARINKAYEWWLSSQATASPTPIPVTSLYDGDLAVPTCLYVVPLPTGAKPTCSMTGYNHEIWFWRTAQPTGSEFCNSSWTAPPGTPTIPGHPNTAVVSGLTLTSPSIYHLFADLTVATLAGTEHKADGGWIRSSDVWRSYTPSDPRTTRPPIITLAQAGETDIFSATGVYKNRRRVTFAYGQDFRILDAFTMRGDKYYSSTRKDKSSPIIQDEVEHLIMVRPTDVVSQGQGLAGLSDCVWAWQGKYLTPGEGYMFDTMTEGQFKEIPVTGTGGGVAKETAKPGSGSGSGAGFTSVWTVMATPMPTPTETESPGTPF